MASTTLEEARKNYKPKPESNRDRLKRVLSPFKGFKKWRKKQGEKKNRSQFERYSKRHDKLSKIKNPNDWQKNQLKHSKRMRDEAGGKIQKKLDYSKKEQESIKKRQNVRKNPVSDETLNTVKSTLEKQRKAAAAKKAAEEAKNQPTKSEKKSEKKSEPKKSNVFTRHYKTGKALGVMTRSQRRAYDKEAAAAGGKSFDERVKATGDKSNKRETNYKASQRKKKNRKKISIKKPSLETYKGNDPNTTAGSNKSDRTKRRIGN